MNTRQFMCDFIEELREESKVSISKETENALEKIGVDPLKSLIAEKEGKAKEAFKIPFLWKVVYRFKTKERKIQIKMVFRKKRGLSKISAKPAT